MCLPAVKRGGVELYRIGHDYSVKNNFSCHLFTTNNGMLMLIVVYGGIRIVDGLIAGPYLADVNDMIDLAEKYGCPKIIRLLDEIRECWDDTEMRLEYEH